MTKATVTSAQITFHTDEWYLNEIARLRAAHQISKEAYAEVAQLSLPEQVKALEIVADIRSMISEGRRAQKH